MKKVIVFMMLIVVSVGFVLAAPGLPPKEGFVGSNISINGSGEEVQIQIMAKQGTSLGQDSGNMTLEQRREMLRGGQELKIQFREQNRAQMREIHLERVQNNLRIRAGNYSVNCTGECELNGSGNNSEIRKRLSNGRNAYVKVMPDTASEVALERLRLNYCNEDNNCTLELKEVSARGNESNNATLAYEIQRERKARVLGVFGARMDVSAQIDAESGEVIRVKKPWWAFLASEPEEE